MRQLAQMDEQVVKMIRQRQGEIRGQSLSDRVATATPHIDCDFLCQFIPALELRQRCSNLLATAPEWLTDEDRKALQIVSASISEDGSIHDPWRGRRRARRGSQSDAESESADRPATTTGEAEAV
jgi:hypothetical protein